MLRLIMTLIALATLTGCRSNASHETSSVRETEECDGIRLELFREPDLGFCWARDGENSASVGFPVSCDVFDKCQAVHSQNIKK